MKKIILFALTCAFSTLVIAQENYTSYKSSYFQKTYDIQVSDKGGGKYTLYIMAPSMDRLYQEVGFSMTEKSSKQFIDKLTEAEKKYSEWVPTAIKNNVTDLSKEMNIETTVEGFFGTSQGWKFDNYVSLSFEFRVLENKYLLLVRSNKLTDGRNEFIDHEGFVLAFSNVSEIDNFLKVISPESITEFISKPKKSDLFN